MRLHCGDLSTSSELMIQQAARLLTMLFSRGKVKETEDQKYADKRRTNKKLHIMLPTPCLSCLYTQKDLSLLAPSRELSSKSRVTRELNDIHARDSRVLSSITREHRCTIRSINIEPEVTLAAAVRPQCPNFALVSCDTEIIDSGVTHWEDMCRQSGSRPKSEGSGWRSENSRTE